MSTFVVHCGSVRNTKRVVDRLARDSVGRNVYVSEGLSNFVVADLVEVEYDEISQFVAIEPEVALAPFAEPLPPGDEDDDDETWKTATLHDILDRIQAPSAWRYSRGEGVTIAVVDSGIRSTADFPLSKRVPDPICIGFDGKAWNDAHGHGSMVASIAAATTSRGGKFNGVAPDADILACRTPYLTASVFMVLDKIIARLKSGSVSHPLVLNHSFGTPGTVPPSFTKTSAHVLALQELIAMGTFVSCAAGNNHDCSQPGFEPDADGPNTIWGPNSLDAVCCVGAVNCEDSNTRGIHTRSSRGPGQWADRTSKPDCVAPSYGEVLWGNAYRAMKWWGTSGAAPQVAGLAALVWSRTDGRLNPDEIRGAILEGCRPITPGAPKRVGRGVIDCLQTLQLVA